MVALLKKLWNDESGQASVEYALVIGLATVAVIGAVVAFREQLVSVWATLTTVLSDAEADINP